MKYLVILFYFLNVSLFSQNITIRGKVLDSQTLKPLPSANIIIENKEIGTSAEKDGSFVLTGNISATDIIKVSYVGYTSLEIPLSGQNLTNLIVKLQPQIIPSQTVFIEGSIGKKGITPVTFDKINRQQIKENYTVQDIPGIFKFSPFYNFLFRKWKRNRL